jgi:hypothetical protein
MRCLADGRVDELYLTVNDNRFDYDFDTVLVRPMGRPPEIRDFGPEFPEIPKTRSEFDPKISTTYHRYYTQRGSFT